MVHCGREEYPVSAAWVKHCIIRAPHCPIHQESSDWIGGVEGSECLLLGCRCHQGFKLPGASISTLAGACIYCAIIHNSRINFYAVAQPDRPPDRPTFWRLQSFESPFDTRRDGKPLARLFVVNDVFAQH